MQGAVELCTWLIAHGSHPELLSMGNATLQSTLSLQIKRLLPGLPACRPAPAPLRFSSPSSLARAKVLPQGPPLTPWTLHRSPWVIQRCFSTDGCWR